MKEIIGASDPTIVFYPSMNKCHEKPNRSFLPDYKSTYRSERSVGKELDLWENSFRVEAEIYH